MPRVKGKTYGPHTKKYQGVCRWCQRDFLATRPDALDCGPVCTQQLARYFERVMKILGNGSIPVVRRAVGHWLEATRQDGTARRVEVPARVQMWLRQLRKKRQTA